MIVFVRTSPQVSAHIFSTSHDLAPARKSIHMYNFCGVEDMKETECTRNVIPTSNLNHMSRILQYLWCLQSLVNWNKFVLTHLIRILSAHFQFITLWMLELNRFNVFIFFKRRRVLYDDDCILTILILIPKIQTSFVPQHAISCIIHSSAQVWCSTFRRHRQQYRDTCLSNHFTHLRETFEKNPGNKYWKIV